MPFYEYEPDDPEASCDHCRGGFEEFQTMSAAALATCPQCDSPVHRILSTFLFHQGTQHVLKQDNLEKHGFTQYKKLDKGVYEKTAGKGPRVIKDGGQ